MDPFERGMMMRGSHPAQQANELNWAEHLERKKERERSEANKTKSLRTYLSEIDPDNKDRFTALGLAELEGLGEAFAVKSAAAKQRREEMKAQQEEQSAAALSRVLQDAGSLNETEVLAEGNGPVRQTRRPVAMTPQRLQAVLGRNPAAVNDPNFAPNINALRALMGDAATDNGAGPVEFTTDPETGTRYGFNRKTGQFGVDPNSRAKANAEAEANKTRFSVEPLVNEWDGKVIGYGVKAQFGSEQEAKAWADQQNQSIKSVETATPDETVYESEAAAKKAGKKTGDVFRLKGVGKVRLK